MPTSENSRMMGKVTKIGLFGTGASQPKYSEMMTAMKTQSSIMNLP